jgi:penicillin-binding protein 2
MPLAIDGREILARRQAATDAVDPRRRLRYCLAGFLVLAAGILARAVQLEVSYGVAFREHAGQPLLRRSEVEGTRGRILARNGVVLAQDKDVPALAVHYRYLEKEPNGRWLRAAARLRLPKGQRKEPLRLADAEARIRTERNDLHRRLAVLCAIPSETWSQRARQIQARVETVAEHVNQRRQTGLRDSQVATPTSDHARPAEASLWGRLCGLILDFLRTADEPAPAEWIPVAEELDYHVMAEEIALEVVAEVESHPDRYPATRIVHRRRRDYPFGRLAAHVLGHVGPPSALEVAGQSLDSTPRPDDRVGQMGVERQYESLLRGTRGTAMRPKGTSGPAAATIWETEPGAGRDVVLSLDPDLQATAESLLDATIARRGIMQPQSEPAGGAVVVLDVHSGAVLAAASAPRFSPGAMGGADRASASAVLTDPAHPLFDRVCRMAIPPGSVFKTISAVALLESRTIDRRTTLECRGYLEDPDQWRCALYRRQGIGHGTMNLTDALARSCNVFFFRYAEKIEPALLSEWARRFGFGNPTGIDLPQEAGGAVPLPATDKPGGRPWQPADTKLLSIGQSTLQVTPLQVARMMAAVANGGLLVTPHVLSRVALPERPDHAADSDSADADDKTISRSRPQRIPGLDAATLAEIRRGLERVVSDPEGTAHGNLRIESLEIAGKTGTAETGPNRLEHAWFAGYVPADRPKLALVVALEHAGDAAEAACPVAKRLVLRMQELGYFRGR